LPLLEVNQAICNGIFLSLTFQCALCNMTLITLPQGTIYLSLTSTGCLQMHQIKFPLDCQDTF